MDDGYEKVDESCNSNVECPLYWVCNRVTRSCEYEATNRFMGTMTCTYEASESPSNASDIVGWLGLEGGAKPVRVRTNVFGTCYSTEMGAQFVAHGVDSTGTQYAFSVTLPFPSAGAFEIVPYDTWIDRTDEAGMAGIHAFPPGSSEANFLAKSAHGVVALDADPSPGARVSLYVDIVMQPTQ
jgi:hypothetical protein